MLVEGLENEKNPFSEVTAETICKAFHQQILFSLIGQSSLNKLREFAYKQLLSC